MAERPILLVASSDTPCLDLPPCTATDISALRPARSLSDRFSSRNTHDGICDRSQNTVRDDQSGDGPPVKVVVVERREAEQEPGSHRER